MFCSSCGKEIPNEAMVCPYCGSRTGNGSVAYAGNGAVTPMGNAASQPADVGDDKATVGNIVASILLPIVGVILGITNLSKKKTKAGTTYLIVGIAAWIIFSILFSHM